MRRVPTYGIIGAGRMARHFVHYLHLLNIPVNQWSRLADPQELTLPTVIANSDPILILISDTAIESFIQNHSILQNKTLIHFSGCLITPLAHGAHPLMTFNNILYPFDVYQKTPFIIDQTEIEFSNLLPGLHNLHFFIPPHLKPFYHALCVMSGNFTGLLWQKFFTELEQTFQLPKEIIYPYLEQTLYNLRHHSQQAITGPLVRNDTTTINANLTALTNDPFQKIYQAFVDAYKPTKEIV